MYADTRWDTPVIAPVKLSPGRQALLDAADYIDRHGWCQGRFGNVGSEMCAAGALIRNWIPGLGENPLSALELYIQAAGWPSIPVWNDAPGQTREKVTRTMRAAALDGWE